MGIHGDEESGFWRTGLLEKLLGPTQSKIAKGLLEGMRAGWQAGGTKGSFRGSRRRAEDGCVGLLRRGSCTSEPSSFGRRGGEEFFRGVMGWLDWSSREGRTVGRGMQGTGGTWESFFLSCLMKEQCRKYQSRSSSLYLFKSSSSLFLFVVVVLLSCGFSRHTLQARKPGNWRTVSNCRGLSGS